MRISFTFTPPPDTAASSPAIQQLHRPVYTRPHRTLQLQFSAASPTQREQLNQTWPVVPPAFCPPYKPPQTQILVT